MIIGSSNREERVRILRPIYLIFISIAIFYFNIYCFQGICHTSGRVVAYAISRDVTGMICSLQTLTAGSGQVRPSTTKKHEHFFCSVNNLIFCHQWAFFLLIGSGVKMAPTNSTPPGWSYQPWSPTGHKSQFNDHDVPQVWTLTQFFSVSYL